MSRTRFLTGSLASLAVASALTLAMPSTALAADLDERTCGQPEVAAVYETVVTDPVFVTVPAVTHDAWLWEREVPTYEFEFATVLTPESVETDWSREIPGPAEYLFTRTVIDSPAVPGVPAVPEVPAIGHFEETVVVPAVVLTEIEYQHERTGNLRWEDADWGAQNGEGRGWVLTGNTREVEIVPAVTVQTWVVDVPAVPGIPAIPAIPEVSHTESVWALTAPGADWTAVDERPGPTVSESTTTTGGAPAGAGWVPAATRPVPAVIDTLWSAVAPEGYTATGNSRVAGAVPEITEEAMASAPEGEGWSRVPDSRTTVVDAPEREELVTPGSVEDVLVSAGLPATEACVAPPVTTPVTTPAGTDPQPTSGVAGPQSAAAAAPVGTVLPNTGNDIPPWMLPAGLGAMLAGIGMIRHSRRTAGI